MPTAAELEAQAQAARRREEEERARVASEQRSRGIWDTIKGFFSGFSFFSILIVGLVLCGAYFLGRTPDGQRLLGGLFGEENVRDFFRRGDEMLGGLAGGLGINLDISATLEAMPIEQVRTTLAERDVPAPLIAILARDQTTFRNFLNVIKTANGGRIGINDLTPEALVAGPALGALLSTTNRANTVALMMAAAPANAGITPATLNALIANGMGADGVPTPQLRRLMTAAVDGSLQTLQDSMNGTNGQFSMVKAVDVLLNAESRALIRSVGTDNIAIAMRDRSPALSKETLDAALAFGDAMDTNPANGGANRPRTLAILRAVASIGSGTSPETAFRNITAQQLSGFFAVPGNQTAVRNLLRVVQPSLARHWGNANQGFAEVLASEPDAANILRFVRGESTYVENGLSWLADRAGVSMQTRLGWAGGQIAANAADVAAFMPAQTPTRPPARPAPPRQ